MARNRTARLAIVAPERPLPSTLHGLVEFFQNATRLSRELHEPSDDIHGGAFPSRRRSSTRSASASVKAVAFELTLITAQAEDAPAGCKHHCTYTKPPRGVFDAVIVSPAYGPPPQSPLPTALLRFLNRQRARGSTLASVCAGAFLLGAAGVLDGHRVTTHWALASELQALCPDAQVDANELIIEDGRLLTAAGTTAWLDLALHFAARLGSAQLASSLGKFYLADTAPREQRCYRVFAPRRSHGSTSIAKAQEYLDGNLGKSLALADVARIVGMSLRNFQRRFKEATGLGPQPYLKRLRVQRACELLETSDERVEPIIRAVGYTDTSAFRKAFRQVTGLSPKEYRQRFQVKP